MNDEVSKQLIKAVAKLGRTLPPAGARAAAVRVSAGLRLTQSARGAAEKLAAVANDATSFAHRI